MSNITNNRINTVAAETDLVAAIQHVKDAGNLFPFLIGLEAGEKKSLQGINVSNKVWVEECLNEMELEPGILPAFIDPSNVKADYLLFNQLERVKVATQDLLDKLSDTQYLAGAEAYAVCLIYYRLVEAAAKAGLPGADERYNRLKARFEEQGPRPNPNSGSTEPRPDTPETPQA